MERVIEQVVHVDEREVCLIQINAAKLPHARLRTDPRFSAMAGVRGSSL